MRMDDFENLFISTHGRSFWETQAMKTTIRLFSFGLALLLSVTVAPQARATCQDACLTNNNTVQGDDALISLTSGYDNTAIGFNALLNNNTGFRNTAIGFSALFSNITSGDNTAIGCDALINNTGGGNTATGSFAMNSNTTGGDNTAYGWEALSSNTIGHDITALGGFALGANTTGSYNTAVGSVALGGNTTGISNTAVGNSALTNLTTGNNNTAMGFNALVRSGRGSNNIALGFSAGSALTSGDNNIDIGNVGVTGESNHIRIGTQGTQTHTFIAGISGATVPTGVAVIVDSTGHLGTSTSSARYKEAIKPMDRTSDAILALKPVTFRYKHDLDPEGIPQFGLVAEEVEKINPDLVTRDEQGKPYSVRYEAVNAMLLNEFLKEHCRVAQLEKQVAALTAGLQKVSAQLEVSKSAPRTALNNQ